MTRRLVIGAIAILASTQFSSEHVSAQASIAFVQVNSAVPQSASTTVAVNYTAAQTAGNLNVIVVGWNDTTAVVQSVVDSRGNVYTRAVGPTARAGSATQSIYYAANITAAPAGGNTVTVTFASAAAFADVRIAEYRGIDPVAPVDVVAGASGSGNSSDSGAATTTSANALIVGANMVQNNTTGPGASFTSRIITNPDGDIFEDRIVTTTGSYNAVAPVSSGWWVMQMVAFRAAGPADPQPPTAPGTPALSVVSSSQINLTWAAATDNVGVSGYRVERCAGAGCSSFTQVAATTNASLNDTGLSASVSYTYRVRAVDASGNLGPYSATASATTPDTQPPSAPGTPVLSVVSSAQINMTWSAAADDVGVTGYFVERCAGAGCTTFAQIGTSATANFTDTALNASTMYRYRVRATDAAGNIGSYSGVASATTQAPPDLEPPTAPGTPLPAVVSSGQIDLTWPAATDNVGVTSYSVQRCAGAGCTAFSDIGTSTTTSFSDAGLNGSTLYSYRVSAADAGGNIGPYSASASAVTLAPPAIALVQHISKDAGSTTSTTVAFTAATTAGNWIAVVVRAGRSGQTIAVTDDRGDTYRRAAQLNETADGTTIGIFYAENIAGGPTTVTVTDSISGGTLRLAIFEYTGIALADSLDASAGNQGAGTAPSSGAATTATPGELVIGVLSAANSQTFAAGSGWTIQERVPSANSKLAIEDQIKSAAGSVSATGVLSSSDSWAAVMASFRPAAVADTQAPSAPGTPVLTVVSGSQISLSWSPAADNVGVTGYLIERCAGSGCSTFVQAGTSSTTGFNDAGLVGATSYSYRVRAADAANNLGPYSTAVAGTTPDTQPPTAPGPPTPTVVSSRQLNLSWPAAVDNVGVVGYLIERCIGIGCATFTQVATLSATSFSDTGLTPSTSYSYRVRAADAANNLSAYSATVTAVTQADLEPPTVAGTPILTVVSSNQINLTWVAATDDVAVASYQVERCAGAGCTAFALVATSTGVAFSNAGLSAGTAYSYRVRAVDAANNLGPYSGTASATTPDTLPPTSPGAVVLAVVSNSQINLTWSPATDDVAVTSYFVERCVGPGCTTFTQVATSASTTFNDTGLTGATSYSYRVRAGDAAGNLGQYSNTVGATTLDTEPPTEPGAFVSNAVSSSRVNLSWLAATDDVGVTGYLLERCTGAGCTTFAPIATPATAGFSDTGLSPSTSYSYRVRATDAANNLGPYSTTATAVTPPDTQPPTAPGAVVSTVVSSSQINLNWIAAGDDIAVTGYLIERCAGAGCSTLLQIGTSAATSFNDTALSAATTYHYRVRATDAAGNLGPYSNTISATTPDTQPPSAPGMPLLVVVSTGRIDLTWPAATDDVGVTGYLVERCVGAGCATFAQVATPATTGFNDTGLSPSTSYSYRVRATDAANNLSPYSTPATTVTQADTQPPASPGTLVVMAVSGTQIALAWTAATDDVGVTSYLVERCTGTSCTTFAQVAAPSTTSFNDAGLVGATSYSYRVRATDAANNLGSYSNAVTATTPDIQPPTAPGLPVLAVISTGRIDITWPAATDDVGVTGYAVERCAGANCSTFTQVAAPLTDRFNDSGLSPATSYTYRVRAMDAANNLSPYSTTATAVTLSDTQPPDTPGTATLTVVSSSQINLTWPAATDDVGVTGYLVERCAGTECSSFAQISTPAAASFNDTGLNASTSYSYRVRATDAANNLSVYSPTSTAVTQPDTQPPTAPGTLVLTVVSSSQIKLTWTASTDDFGVTGYVVERCVGAGCATFAPIGAPASLTFTDIGLSPATTYSYRVRATDAAGNLGQYTNVASASTPDTQPPTEPGALSLTVVSATQTSLTWPAASDDVAVTRYLVERCTGAGCGAFAQVATTPTTSFNDAGLAPLTSYTYRVRGSDAANNLGAYSTTATGTTLADTQAPSAPGAPVLSVVSSGQINLAWPASTDDVSVTGYSVERCSGADCVSFAQVGAPAAVSFNDTGLSPSTSYSYRVRATDAAGNLSSYSTPATAVTLPDTQAPTAPGTPVLTVVSSTQINLAWPPSSDNAAVTGYLVERCAGIGCTAFAQVGTSTGVAFIDTQLTTSTTYRYRVRATDAVGNLGSYSDIATATTPDTQPPTAPGTPVLTVVSASQINLTWAAATDDVAVARYLIERCAGDACTTFGQVGVTPATTFASGGLIGSTVYSFRVRAADATNNVSAYSPAATATTLTPDPIALVQHVGRDAGFTTSTSLAFAADTTAGNWIAVAIRAGRSGQTFTVSDTAGNTYRRAVQLNETTDATTLAIYYAENIIGGATTVTVADSITGGTLRIAILEYAGVARADSLDGIATGEDVSAGPGTDATPAVSAGDLALSAFSSANSRTFSAVNEWTLQERVPAPPSTKLAVEDAIVSTTGSISAAATLSSSDSWGAVVATFHAAAPLPTPDLTIVKAHAGTFIQGQAGAAYTISVLNGGTGPSSGTVTVTDTLPGPLTASALSGPGWTCTLATLTCTRSDALQPGSYYPDITLTTGVSFTAPTSVANTATVSGGGETNIGNNSAVDVAAVAPAPPDNEPPSAPGTLTTVAVSGIQVNLSWGPSTDNVAISGYRVERCQGNACTGFVKLATPTGTSYIDTGLIPNATYTYIVRAVDVANNLGPYSNASSVTTLANNPNLVAAYSFDENTGTIAADLSGTGNPGTIAGAAWTSTGRYGSALLFSGVNGRVTVADSASLHLTTGMTLEAWVNPSTAAGSWMDIIYKGNDNYYLDMVGAIPAAGITLTPSKASSATGPALPINTWTHLAETFDGTNLRLYINGVQAASTTVPGSLVTSTNALEIGSDHIFGQYFQGMIDEVRVYNVALTPTQIQTDMATPVGSSVPILRLNTVGLNFGLQGTGIPSSPMEAVLTNTGGTALSITGFAVTGPNAADFALTTTCGSTLAAHDSCLVDVTMTASAAGGELATIVISDNATGAPHTIGLTGTGVGFSINPRTSTITYTLVQQFNVIGGTGPYAWSVDGVEGGTPATGTISPTGLYTPPAADGTHVVTVTTADLTKTSSATVYVTNFAGVLTHHNDNFRTGQNLNETTLTPSNVTPSSFGKLFSYSLDGLAMASPLYVANVRLPDASIHNVVYVATQHDSVYAFDADGRSPAALWQRSFISPEAGPNVTTVPSADTGECCDISPEIGITGTPVIDAATGTLYVVAKTKEGSGSSAYKQRLHALDITTGAEKFGGPILLQASAPGTGMGAQGGIIPFDALHENQRPALLLSNGVVYITFGSHGDNQPYHGWVLGYDATTLQQTMALNLSPDDSGAGIWQANGGPAADAAGNIYVVTGNGGFNANTGGRNYGDSFVKITPAGTVVDYFTPHDQASISSRNFDLGAAGPMLLPDQSGAHPHLIVSAGKNNTVYLLDRENMGHYNASTDNQIVQSLVNIFPYGTPEPGNYSGAVFFNGKVYFGPIADNIQAFTLTNGLLSTSATSRSKEIYSYPGATMSISANGNANGILWAIQRNGDCGTKTTCLTAAPGVLRAYDASNLTFQLYSSDQAPGGRDALDFAAKFSVPLVANGKVFVGSMGRLTVYGLLP